MKCHGEAVRLHNSELSTLHLLKPGHTGKRSSSTYFRKNGLDWGKLTRDLQEFKSSDSRKGSTGRVQSGEMNLVGFCPEDEAEKLRDEYVSVEHLLLALTDGGDKGR
ncbi:MAG: hypothetical protein CM1200mP30_06500 [Pseudomonadota bacterium]|nr:MAG: hypothetical protein CM1200mP30_06500 [Pseudomonadota bacterium]